MFRNISNSEILSKIYISLTVSAIAVAFNILYTMSILYVHTFFGLIYCLTLLIGIFIGNITLSLFHWKNISRLGISFSLFILFTISFYIFPFAHIHYSVYSWLRLSLLLLIFLIGLLGFLLFKYSDIYSSNKRPLEVYFLLLLSTGFMLVLQTYMSMIFTGSFVFVILFVLSMLVYSRNIFQSLFSILCLIIFSLVFWLFQNFSLFLIHTPEENKASLFDKGTQIDFKVSKPATLEFLDIATNYQGQLPTRESIYSNGRYYGQLIGDVQALNYAEYTPYNILYSLREAPKVLILNSAGGGDVYLTHKLISGEIDALEKNQEVLNQIRDKESLYVGGIYHNRNTLFYRTSIRPYIASTDKSYDILVLKYQILKPEDILFLAEDEQNLSINAFKNYFRILNPQGLLFFTIKTFDRAFNEAILLKLISTFKEAIPFEAEEILKRIHIFQTPNSLNLILSKVPFSDEKEVLYNEKIQNLSYTYPKQDLSNSLQAIIKGDKNLISRIPFNTSPIRDDWNNWFFQIAQTYNLWSSRAFSFSFSFTQITLLTIGFLGISCLLLSRSQFQLTNLYKMGLGSFFSYFLSLGLALGLAIIFGLDFFNYLLSNDIISGSWGIATIFASRILSEIIFNLIGKIYLCIRISLIAQILINIFLLFILTPLRDTLIALPLVFKILVPTVVISLVYVFIITPIISGFLWVKYMETKDSSSLRSSFFLGVILGVSFGSYIIFYVPAFWILVCNILLLFIGYLFSIFLDKKSKEIDYVYSKERI